MDFTEWLHQQLEKRGMSQADLARKSGLSRARISQVLSGDTLTADFVISVARALKTPIVPILELADIIPRQPRPEDPEAKRLLDAWARFPEDERRVLLDVLERAGKR